MQIMVTMHWKNVRKKIRNNITHVHLVPGLKRYCFSTFFRGNFNWATWGRMASHLPLFMSVINVSMLSTVFRETWHTLCKVWKVWCKEFSLQNWRTISITLQLRINKCHYNHATYHSLIVSTWSTFYAGCWPNQSPQDSNGSSIISNSSSCFPTWFAFYIGAILAFIFTKFLYLWYMGIPCN